MVELICPLCAEAIPKSLAQLRDQPKLACASCAATFTVNTKAIKQRLAIADGFLSRLSNPR
jgi:hypothetical protein